MKSHKIHIKNSLLVPFGKLMGLPEIQHASPLINGGNFLYYWLYAYNNCNKGIYTKVQEQSNILMWFEEFPWLKQFSIQPTSINRWFSNWNGSSPDIIGEDFSKTELHQFSKDLVSSSKKFINKLEKYNQIVDSDTCVINIRRGDYYQHPHLIQQYGLNSEEHIKNSLQIMPGNISKYIIVSDDIGWCLDNISPILPGKVSINTDRENMFDDMALLVTAPTLVLANSTFSFWGGHIGDALQPERLVIAPPYHFINPDGSKNTDRFDKSWIMSQ